MIERVFKALYPFINYVITYPFRILLVSLLTAFVGFWLATNLKIDNDLSKLIPQSYPSVQALNTLREQVGAENEMAVAIESPSYETNKKFAEALIPKALALINPETTEPFFRRVEFRKEIGFLEENALYFATDQELDLLQEFLETRTEEAKQEANPFYFDFGEEESTTDSLAGELDSMYDELIGSEYLVSDDSLAMAVKFYPSGSQTDLQFIEDVYDAMQKLVDEMEPASYHPEMEVTLAGRLLRTLIEVETITKDVKDSFGIGVLMLLLVVVLYFFYKSYRISAGSKFNGRVLLQEIVRIPTIVVIMASPLVISLCWTFGIAYLLFGNLNIMTSTLGLLLFGMGIDFGIHFFARYSEERASDQTVSEALITTFMTTGQAVTAVGITTSAAFLVLSIADFKGFSEFGIIAGLGLLFAILAYVVFLPALISILERFRFLNLKVATDQQVAEKHHIKTLLSPKLFVPLILFIGIGVTVYTITNLPKVTFQYDFSELEPEYVRYQELNSKVRKVYSDRRTRNAAYIVTDTPEDAQKVAEVLRERAASDTLTPTIDRVEIFQDRFPFLEQEGNQKIDRIAEIRELLSDPFLEGQDDRQLDRLRQAASTQRLISLDEVPDFLRNPFTSQSGEIGNLVLIYPGISLGDGRNSINFADDVGEVPISEDKTYYAGSTSIVASDMLRLMIDEAPVMVSLTIVIIIILKLVVLGSVKWTLLALLPLLASFVWMFGLMVPLGWQLNFYNLVVLPTVLGIGDDSGIHLVHRYLEEGKGSIAKVLHSTGEHITVSVATTIMGFGGLLFSLHPGMQSIGELAILGIVLTLLAALFLLPAVLVLMEKREAAKEISSKE
ncbi:MAG: efflux RND transporter permease subunit [Bacteroidota bacterium]